MITDFQEGSPYISQMKGVIYKINPDACVVDITHSIPPHNVEIAAFILSSAVKYIPDMDIIVGVVDPGVGTERRPIIVETNTHTFIGPDNGLFSFVGQIRGMYVINISRVARKETSYTFHGRDIFAPAAALLSYGVRPEEIGIQIKSIKILPRHPPEIGANEIKARVIYIDPFGNVILNVSSELAKRVISRGSKISINVGERRVEAMFANTYGEVQPGEPLLLIDSFDLLEFAINMGNAAKRYSIRVGDEVVITPQND